MSGENLPRFGRARIQPLASGNYRPSDDGEWAVILEVRDRHNELADLVAWLPNDPARWWLRHGDEAPVLGARALAFAADCHEPVILHPTPETWLFAHQGQPGGHLGQRHGDADGDTVCILDWGVDLAELFAGVSKVECQGADLQNRFQQALRVWEPQITVPRQGARRVA